MLRIYGAEERREEEGLYGSTIETPQQTSCVDKPCGCSWMAAKRTMGRQGAASSSTKIDGPLFSHGLQKLQGARVLTEVLDLISTEQMTELTAFKVTDRIVRDARTQN